MKNVKLGEAPPSPRFSIINKLTNKASEETQISSDIKSISKEPEFTNCATCGIEFGKILDTQKFW